MFEANFIGIVFARTLHFQFYVWFALCLPGLGLLVEQGWGIAASARARTSAGLGHSQGQIRQECRPEEHFGGSARAEVLVGAVVRVPTGGCAVRYGGHPCSALCVVASV